MEPHERAAGVSYTISLSPDHADLAQQNAASMNVTVESFIETIVWAYFNDFVDWLKVIAH